MQSQLTRNTLSALALTLALGSAMSAYAATDPQALRNDSYVTLSGTIGKVLDGDEFMLKTAEGDIKIDTNDTWPGLFDNAAGTFLKQGDKVTVTGQVDDNYFTAKEIDAYSISYRGQDYSTFYQTDDTTADQNTYYYYPFWYTYDDTNTRISGTVSEVVDNNTFRLNYTGGTILVDASDTQLDNANSLRVGDRVIVYGDVEDNWWQKRELEANTLFRIDRYPTLG